MTAVLEHPARGPVEFLVQVSPSSAGNDAAAGYTLSPNRLLRIAQGSTSSTGTVTITARDDDDDTSPGARETLHVRGYRQAGTTSALATPWRALEIVVDALLLEPQFRELDQRVPLSGSRTMAR